MGPHERRSCSGGVCCAPCAPRLAPRLLRGRALYALECRPRRRRPGARGRRNGARARRRRGGRTSRDQPLHLRHELRRTGARGRTRAARGPLGRQRDRDLQLPHRRRQHRLPTTTTRTSRTAGAKRTTGAAASAPTTSSPTANSSPRTRRLGRRRSSRSRSPAMSRRTRRVNHPLTCGFPATRLPEPGSVRSLRLRLRQRHEGRQGAGERTHPRRHARSAPPTTANSCTTSSAAMARPRHGGVGDLRARQRARALGQHPPRHPSPARPATTSSGKSRAKRRSPSRNRTRARKCSASPSGAGRTTSAAPPTARPRAPARASSPDRAAHGGTPLVEWLLQQFHAYRRKHRQAPTRLHRRPLLRRRAGRTPK